MIEFSVPESFPYLLGVLGLLLAWELHQIEVTAGRIIPSHFWNLSGILKGGVP